MATRIFVYGDSLLKATEPDENFHYHFHISEVIGKYVPKGIEIVNRAKMGATVRKGKSLVEHDLARGMDAKYAILDYGGNDCDFNWDEVAENPEAEHHCHTEMPVFLQTLQEITDSLRQRGVQPVLMTLPPVDGERYLDCICRKGLDKSRILRWLGSANTITRYQKWYSDSVAEFARKQQLPLVPAREAFLADDSFGKLIAADGIHLNQGGYHRFYSTISNWMQKNLGKKDNVSRQLCTE